MATRPKRPADFAQRAKLMIDIATGCFPRDPPFQPESARAIVGRKGGLKGGKARARKLSAYEAEGDREEGCAGCGNALNPWGRLRFRIIGNSATGSPLGSPFLCNHNRTT